MGCIKYEVWIDGVCVAKEVELETAFDICKAYQNKYYNETEFKFIIKTADAEQTEPKEDCRRCKLFATETCRDCRGGDLFKDSGYVTETKQTEPNSSEKPNNCEDEPQTEECPFDDPIPCEWVCTEWNQCKYKHKDEPQTEPNTYADGINDAIKAVSAVDDYGDGVGFEVKNHALVELELLKQTDCAWK